MTYTEKTCSNSYSESNNPGYRWNPTLRSVRHLRKMDFGLSEIISIAQGKSTLTTREKLKEYCYWTQSTPFLSTKDRQPIIFFVQQNVNISRHPSPYFWQLTLCCVFTMTLTLGISIALRLLSWFVSVLFPLEPYRMCTENTVLTFELHNPFVINTIGNAWLEHF